jgi:hypothetical protein
MRRLNGGITPVMQKPQRVGVSVLSSFSSNEELIWTNFPWSRCGYSETRIISRISQLPNTTKDHFAFLTAKAQTGRSTIPRRPAKNIFICVWEIGPHGKQIKCISCGQRLTTMSSLKLR